MNNFPSDDTHITSIHTLYSQLKIYPQSSQYTVLSAFYLTSSTSRDCKIISIGTGTKCLPKCRLPIQGEAVHDSHAEILARRGAIRWLLEEILHYRVGGSQWIERQAGVYRFREGIHLHMYISTVPCGDASTRFLAASQDPEMASMKNSAAVSHDEGTAARGRNNYNLFNVLRTKPGRADSPPTLSLSCSDKIASWSWLGIQGAFGATFFTQGIYIRKIVIGEVLSSKDSELVEAVSGDCERALSGRLDGLLTTGKEPYSLHKPVIAFTPIPFVHSRLVVGLGTASTSSNDSLCWYAAPAPGPLLPSSFPVSHTEKEETAKTLLSYDNGSQNHSNSSSAGTVQVLINGYKRGVSPKHRTTLNNVKFLLVFISMIPHINT
ncbi:adenosine deaminase/editase [Lentinula aciculospora]|uniref:Adenosine deaminase/editase n=1 Tax=Lentinula aciculospora TaxID=153920 RepID=A0A9W9DIF6_9AGAR|nr:adenosine deaminase/editase [Lentinula aciculospora]